MPDSPISYKAPVTAQATNSVHVDSQGSAKGQVTPALIKAESQGRNDKLRITITGWILAALTICLAFLIYKDANPSDKFLSPIIGLIGTGFGYLMSSKSSNN